MNVRKTSCDTYCTIWPKQDFVDACHCGYIVSTESLAWLKFSETELLAEKFFQIVFICQNFATTIFLKYVITADCYIRVYYSFENCGKFLIVCKYIVYFINTIN